MKKKFVLLLVPMMLLTACDNDGEEYDKGYSIGYSYGSKCIQSFYIGKTSKAFERGADDGWARAYYEVYHCDKKG